MPWAPNRPTEIQLLPIRVPPDIWTVAKALPWPASVSELLPLSVVPIQVSPATLIVPPDMISVPVEVFAWPLALPRANEPPTLALALTVPPVMVSDPVPPAMPNPIP